MMMVEGMNDEGPVGKRFFTWDSNTRETGSERKGTIPRKAEKGG